MSVNDLNYDVVGGADQNTLNAMAASFYDAFPSIFVITLDIGQPALASVVIDFQTAPMIAIAPPPSFVEEARALAADLVDQGKIEDGIEEGIAELTAGTMNLSCSKVSVTFNVAGTPLMGIAGSLTCAGAVAVTKTASGSSALILSVANAVVAFSPDPLDLAKVFNTYAAGPLCDYLNACVLPVIAIPALTLPGVTLVMPTITDETAPSGNPFLLAYSGLQPVSLPPGGTEWPANVLFVGIDGTAVNAIAANEMPSYSGSGGCSRPNLSWDYKLVFSPTFDILPGAGNTLTVSMAVYGGADITWHTPGRIPNITFGGSITGSCSASAQLIALPMGNGQEIGLIIVDAGDFDLSVSISGMPFVIAWFVDKLADLILDSVTGTAAAFLQNFPFPLFSLAPIQFSLPNSVSGQLTLDNLTLDQIAGADGLALLTVTAQPTFSQNAAVTVRKTVRVGRPRRAAAAPRPTPEPEPELVASGLEPAGY